MSRPLLGDVLESLLGSVVDSGEHVDPLSGTGLVVSEALIELPLEGVVARENDEIVLRAAPPMGTMKTGFELPTTLARFSLVEIREDDA